MGVDRPQPLPSGRLADAGRRLRGLRRVTRLVEPPRRAVQQAQDDFSKVLGLQANDLLGVDFKDANQKEAWIWLYFKGVSDACNVLRIGP